MNNSEASDFTALMARSKVILHKKGTILLRPFDDSEYLYVINSGLVKGYTVNSLGEESIVVIYGPTELFPIAWILQEKRQNVYFQALSDCEIGCLPRKEFNEHLFKSPHAAYEIMQKVLEQFMLYASQVCNLELKYARERLAYRLLLLAAKFGKKVGTQVYIPSINQHDLGAMINVSRESISREISRLERMGIIEHDSSRILIKDALRLRTQIGKDVTLMFFDGDI